MPDIPLCLTVSSGTVNQLLGVIRAFRMSLRYAPLASDSLQLAATLAAELFVRHLFKKVEVLWIRVDALGELKLRPLLYRLPPVPASTRAYRLSASWLNKHWASLAGRNVRLAKLMVLLAPAALTAVGLRVVAGGTRPHARGPYAHHHAAAVSSASTQSCERQPRGRSARA